MRIKDFETLSRLIGGDVRKQHSVLKGQFHAYIMRRMRWHAKRYYYRKRDKVITISLEDMNEDVPDEQEEERMRCRELLIALQQELPHLTPTERQIAQSLLKKSCNETAAAMELCNSTVYRTRRKIGKRLTRGRIKKCAALITISAVRKSVMRTISCGWSPTITAQ